MYQDSVSTWNDTVEFQVGVTGRKQALGAGLSRNVVRRRMASGTWHRLHRGVYATFTGSPPRQAELWAAILRAGPGATLSHQTAAELHGLTDKPSEQIHVTVPATRNPARYRKVSGVIIHRSSRIDAARHPALSPPRTRVEDTVLDLVETARHFDEAFSWLCRAVGRRRTTVPLLAAAVAARRRIRWRGELVAALTDVAGGVHSLLERRYVVGVERAHGLPPRRGRPGGGMGPRQRTWTTCTRSTRCALRSTARSRIPQKSAGSTTGATTLIRSSEPPHSDSAGRTPPRIGVRAPSWSLTHCAAAAGRVLRPLAPPPAQWHVHDRVLLGAQIDA